jgi:hypothetical protein
MVARPCRPSPRLGGEAEPVGHICRRCGRVSVLVGQGRGVGASGWEDRARELPSIPDRCGLRGPSLVEWLVCSEGALAEVSLSLDRLGERSGRAGRRDREPEDSPGPPGSPGDTGRLAHPAAPSRRLTDLFDPRRNAIGFVRLFAPGLVLVSHRCSGWRWSPIKRGGQQCSPAWVVFSRMGSGFSRDGATVALTDRTVSIRRLRVIFHPRDYRRAIDGRRFAASFFRTRGSSPSLFQRSTTLES